MGLLVGDILRLMLAIVSGEKRKLRELTCQALEPLWACYSGRHRGLAAMVDSLSRTVCMVTAALKISWGAALDVCR